MQDVDEVFPKPIKDFVWVVRDNFYEDLRSARGSTAARMISHDLDGLSKTRRDDTCAPRGASLQVVQDCFEVGFSTSRKADDHRPKRFQISAT
jgi:hypothetical protein